MLTLALLLLAGAALVAFTDWRCGLYATLVVAFAQDPLRKLTEGQPPIYVLFAGVVFAAAVAGALAAGARIGPAAIPGFRADLRVPVLVYLALIALQTLNGGLRLGAFAPAMLGLVTYVAPLLALGLAAAFARGGPDRLARWLKAYLALSTLFCLSVAAQAYGYASPLFGEVGPGIRLYGPNGEIVANCGLFRTSEIAGWHAATAGAVAILLLTRRRIDARRLALALLAAIAFGAIAALTGRRKAPLLLITFAALYFSLASLYLRGGARAVLAVAALSPLAYVSVGGWLAASETVGVYGERALSALPQASARAFDTAWAPLQTVLDVYGPLGGGIGLSTQGAQYAGLGDADPTFGAGEGGVGKLAIELGAPGCLAALWLALACARRMTRGVAGLAVIDPAAARFNCGLVAILGANAINFGLASQTYGDVFVLLFLGLVAGAALAAPARRTASPRSHRPRMAIA